MSGEQKMSRENGKREIVGSSSREETREKRREKRERSS